MTALDGPRFKVAHAAAGPSPDAGEGRWARAAKDCADTLVPLPDGANLGFLYATDHFADDLGNILTYLREKTGVDQWIGTIGFGICAGASEYFDRPAVAAMVGAFPAEGFHILPSLSGDAEDLSAETKDWIGRGGAPFAIVHGDPGNAKTPAIIQSLGAFTSGFLVGGLTASRGPNHQVAGRVTGGGVSGALFGPSVEVATGLTQGCAPLGGQHVVSDCVDNVVIGLDGRRPLDVFREDVGELLSRDLSRVAGYIHAAFPIEGSDTGDYMVRSLIGIDPMRGWIAIDGELSPGDRIMFVRRDPSSAAADLESMADTLKRRLPGAPKAGVYFSCVARGVNMFGTEGREVAMLRKRLGDFPLIGFYAGGEISNCRLYGYTGVLALFL